MLTNYPGFQTDDPEISRAIMASRYDVLHFDCRTDEGQYQARANSADTKYFRITTASTSLSTVIRYEAAPALRQFFVADLSTFADFTWGRDHKAADPEKRSTVIPAGTRYKGVTYGPSAFIALRLALEPIAKILSGLIAVDISPDQLLERPWKSSNDYASTQTALLSYMADLTNGLRADCYISDILSQAVVARFVLETASLQHDFLQSVPTSPSVQQIARIEAFLAENCERDPDIEVLAAEFGISVRSIYRHFRAFRGATPNEFVRMRRLDRARSMLSSGSENVSVIAIALQCGFQGMGHFARQYKQAFGELPSHTIKRARRSSGKVID